MLTFKPYYSETAEKPLQLITSDNGFYLYKDGRYYESVIASQEDKDAYIESNIALPSKKLSKEEAYEVIFKKAQLTKEQVENIYSLILKQFMTLSDEEALQNHFIFPEWQNNLKYNAKEKIKYNNNLYEVSQNHTSSAERTPDKAPGLYRRIKINLKDALEWEQKAYDSGDRIKYGEHIFESLINNNIWSPENFPDSWKLIQ